MGGGWGLISRLMEDTEAPGRTSVGSRKATLSQLNYTCVLASRRKARGEVGSGRGTIVECPSLEGHPRPVQGRLGEATPGSPREGARVA